MKLRVWDLSDAIWKAKGMRDIPALARRLLSG